MDEGIPIKVVKYHDVKIYLKKGKCIGKRRTKTRNANKTRIRNCGMITEKRCRGCNQFVCNACLTKYNHKKYCALYKV